MTRLLDVRSDLQLVEYQANSVIERAILEWPELTDFIRSWRKFDVRNSAEFNDSEVALRSLIVGFIRLCTSGPYSPSDYPDSVNELENSFTVAAETSSSNRADILGIFRRFQDLLGTLNPASRFLENWISSRRLVECPRDHVRQGEPSVAIVLRDEIERERVVEWLAELELHAATTTYRELRKGHAHQYLVFFGTPDRYVSSAWLRSPNTWFQSQWLVTAPASSTSLFLSWPGHPNWQEAHLGPWSGSRVPKIIELTTMPNAQGEDLSAAIEFFPVEVSEVPVISEHKHDLVNAVGFELFGASGTEWIYFSSSHPPRPRAMTSDRQQIEFLTPSQLRPGVMLVVNDNTARPEVLDEYTHRYWAEHYPGVAIERAIAAKKDVKAKIGHALETVGRDELVRRLAASGLAADYARLMLGNILADDYIAPRRKDVFDHLEKAGGFSLAPDAGKLLRHLRVSRQQAGVDINDLLRRKLLSSGETQILEKSDRQGWCALDTPDLGRISIHRIRSIASTERAVPRSWLGRPKEIE